ncbi:MAG: hypothetical protein MJK14_13690 [Rivularia sp. ALOHA_DT_140]|nr:hypothetical protein [Rivularia sp. ALOHA_DT_140]
MSRGEWVHVLHDDDSVCPGFYSQLQESLKDCPDSVGAACSGFQYMNEYSEAGRIGEMNLMYKQQKGVLTDFLASIGVCGLIMTPALVIRRTTHERLGGYCGEIPYINDWELHKRIAALYDWWYEPDMLASFRVHSDSRTSYSWNSGKIAIQVCQAIEISDSYLPSDCRAEITTQARIKNFNYCLTHALIPLNNGNLQGTLTIIESAIKIDKSSQSVTKLFNWLAQDNVSPVREVIASNLIALNL